jgi:hypothetical protein
VAGDDAPVSYDGYDAWKRRRVPPWVPLAIGLIVLGIIVAVIVAGI